MRGVGHSAAGAGKAGVCKSSIVIAMTIPRVQLGSPVIMLILYGILRAETDMWTIFLAEAFLALAIVGGFIWWVIPKKPPKDDNKDEQ